MGSEMCIRDRLSIERGVSYLMISHDISLVDGFTDNILIMKDGAIIERGPTQAVFDNPQEDYTKALIDAAPFARSRKRPVGQTTTDQKE